MPKLGYKQTEEHKNKRKGISNYNYKEIGTIKFDKMSGYTYIKTAKGPWIKEHRLIVESYIGRKLISGELVHHIDGNKLNNNLENLYIFKNQESHFAFEILIRNKLFDRYYFKSNLDEYKLSQADIICDLLEKSRNRQGEN